MMLRRGGAKAAEGDARKRSGARGDFRHDGADRNPRSTIGGEAINPRRDR